MRILLINANKNHKHTFMSQVFYKLNSSPILVLQQVAAATPTKHSVKLIDDRYDPPDYDSDVDLVGISTLTASAPRAYMIADEYRKRGKPVVLGGFHPSALPEEAKRHADSVVIGEAENTWPQLLEDFEKGNLRSFYKSNSPVSPADIPEPQRELIRLKPLVSPVITSRGCPYYCSFCTLAHLYGRVYRPRPIENVIREIEKIPQKFLVFVHDSSLTIDKDYAKTLFKAMIPLKKKFWSWGSTPTLLRDDELLRLSEEAGCLAWCFGFESICQDSLKEDAKKAYSAESYHALVKKIHKYGMNVYGSFVLGFDHDKSDIFDETLQAAYDFGIDAAEFDILTPFPITRLFHQLEKEGRILTRDWTKYDLHHVVFRPMNMTPKELFNGVTKISKKFYSPEKMFQRMTRLTVKTRKFPNILVFGAINISMARFHSEYVHL